MHVVTNVGGDERERRQRSERGGQGHVVPGADLRSGLVGVDRLWVVAHHVPAAIGQAAARRHGLLIHAPDEPCPLELVPQVATGTERPDAVARLPTRRTTRHGQVVRQAGVRDRVVVGVQATVRCLGIDVGAARVTDDLPVRMVLEEDDHDRP